MDDVKIDIALLFDHVITEIQRLQKDLSEMEVSIIDARSKFSLLNRVSYVLDENLNANQHVWTADDWTHFWTHEGY